MATKVVISPHCDDALLSLGGTMLKWRRSSHDVLVITLFGTCGWSVEPEADLAELSEVNRAEEAAALRAADVGSICLTHPEVLLRGYDEWNAPPKKADQVLCQRLAADIMDHVPAGAEVFAPLAIGSHTDHVVTHRAVLAATDTLAQRGCKVSWYEDVPYVWYEPLITTVTVGGVKLKPLAQDVTEEFMRKCKLLRMYKSQIGPSEISKVREYAGRITEDGTFRERTWQS